MRHFLIVILGLLGFFQIAYSQTDDTTFPDGTIIPSWFRENTKIKLKDLGKTYTITDFGVNQDSTKVQTNSIQKVIDLAASNGGGVIVIPKGVFLSGALFF